jgi:hypothetical protein
MEDGKSRTEEAITARLTGQVESKLGACKKCGYGQSLCHSLTLSLTLSLKVG